MCLLLRISSLKSYIIAMFYVSENVVDVKDHGLLALKVVVDVKNHDFNIFRRQETPLTLKIYEFLTFPAFLSFINARYNYFRF